MDPAQTIFQNLSGAWTLDREIVGQGHLSGQVEFTPRDDGRLQYEEKGVLKLGTGEAIEARRRYIYERKDETLIIYYDDPFRKDEIMHELHFREHEDGYIASHSHLCGDDRYDLTFQFNSRHMVKIHYAVNGPNKNYKMRSVLTREP